MAPEAWGQRLGRPNDEGVDGVISEDSRGSTPFFVVGIKDIQAFSGALVRCVEGCICDHKPLF